MFREMLRAKIHRVVVTEADLDYEGSLTLDADLLDAAGMVPFEKIEVYNVARGTRFATYALEGRRGSGVCCVNGAAAHLASPGDRVIVASYAVIPEADVRSHRPKIVLVGEGNRIREIKSEEREGTRVV